MHHRSGHSASAARDSGRDATLAVALATIVALALLDAGRVYAQSAEDFLQREELVMRCDGGVSHVRIYSADRDHAHGEYVLLLPSLGRGVEDFTEEYHSNLTTRLAQRGYRVVLIQPRGIGESTGELEGLTVTAMVDDIAQVMDYLRIERAHFVGHALGNRIARSFATLYPDQVLDVTLLAAGGQVPLSNEQRDTLFAIFFTEDDDERLALVDKGFFAEGQDASIWLDGWYADPALAQASAVLNPDVYFLEGGGRPILLIQPAEDFIAPPADAGLLLKEQLGAQVTYVEIADSGHALLPERPDAVAATITNYFALQRLLRAFAAQGTLLGAGAQ